MVARYLLSVWLAAVCHTSFGGTVSTVQFEDLTLNTRYLAGDQFESEGVAFRVLELSGGFTPRVDVSDFVLPPLSEINIVTSRSGGLEPVLGDGVVSLSIDYLEGGGLSRIVVNGVESPTSPRGDGRISDSDGLTLGGVLVEVDFAQSSSPRSSLQFGQITLTGPINQFAIGGSELYVDTLRFTRVPEPGACWLMTLASVAVTGCRARRQ